MSNIRQYNREGCLLSAMSFPEEIALENQRIFTKAGYAQKINITSETIATRIMVT